MKFLRLSLRSMRNRSLTTVLTLFSMALSVALLLGIQRIREGTKESFEHSLSGMDVVVGARGGPLQLLLYSVFHIGAPNNNISWQSYKMVQAHPDVAWSIPISMGDSLRGFPVLGTNEQYFEHFRSRGKQLSFTDGQRFNTTFEAVLGADVAKNLDFKLGQKIVLSHGMGEASFHDHDETPFTIVGILEKTGTPADRTVHVSLESLEAMHADWQDAASPSSTHVHDHHGHDHEHEHDHGDHAAKEDLAPTQISAILVSLKAKQSILSFQRAINDYTQEPLLGIIPGLTFTELWSIVSSTDTALLIVSLLVIAAGVLGMLATLLSALEGRRREIAILRALGARPLSIFALFLSEALLLGLGACIFGLLLVYPLIFFTQPFMEKHYGIAIPLRFGVSYDWVLLGSVMSLACLAGCIPAIRAYRRSLADGLTIRI